jgi:hypothetical protein
MMNDADARSQTPEARRPKPDARLMSAVHLYRCLGVGSDVTQQVQDQAVIYRRPNISSIAQTEVAYRMRACHAREKYAHPDAHAAGSCANPTQIPHMSCICCAYSARQHSRIGSA